MGCTQKAEERKNDDRAAVSLEPRVTVLMLTVNRPQTLDRAIESIFAQTYENWELIVVQDGDHKEVTKILQRWEAADSRVIYVRMPQRGSIAEANNYGLKRARGEYIAILDDDDYWREPNKLERQIDFLDRESEYVCCGGGAVCIDSKGQETLRYLKPEHHEAITKRAIIANPMIHSTIMYRRKDAKRLGFYDESLPGFQDWDLVLKLGTLGKLYNFQDHFLAYQIWEGGGSFGAQRNNTVSAVRIVKRHGDNYQGFGLAITMAYAYYVYARLPIWVKRGTFGVLSRAKKALFSSERIGTPTNRTSP